MKQIGNSTMSDGRAEGSTSGVFVHDKGLCESSTVGEGTRIWAFAHVLDGARIGRDCNICDHVFIEGDVEIGDSATIKCGVQLWDGLRVGDRVFIGPNATFTNDRFPRSKQYPPTYLQTVIEDDASIGANATILPGLRIGRGAMVGAGAVVTRNVPPHAVVVGNPAVIIGYNETRGGTPQSAELSTPLVGLGTKIGSRQDLMGGAYLERIPNYADMRGRLSPLELGKGLPFRPERIFLVYDVPSHHVRGEHAHIKCAQFLVAANRGVSVVLDDGTDRTEVRLADPSVGLYLPPKVWGIQYKFEPGTVLMVIASDPYDPADYIRDYDSFLQRIGQP